MKNLRQTIEEKILTINPELETIELIDQNLSIEAITIELMREDIILFSFEYRESDRDSWLQVEYFSKKLMKSVIFEYDTSSVFETDEDKTALEYFIDDLVYYQEKIEAFENKINFN